MNIQQIILIFTSVFCIFSVISLILGLYCVIEVQALKKSTHTVQLTPVDQDWGLSEKKEKDINTDIKEDYEDFLGL